LNFSHYYWLFLFLFIDGFSISTSYITNGVANTDLAIFVKYGANTIANAIASAAACMYDQNGRPTFGLITIYSAFFDDKYSAIGLDVVLHELIHVLGFSSSLIPTFRDSNGIRYTAPTITESRTGNGVTVDKTKLTTPYVKQAVRAHFNCPTLSGAELEESGALSAGSHWDMRLFIEDIMSPAAYWINPAEGRAIISNVTLGLLQDSGWYQVNFAMAKPMKWLAGSGCEVDKRCSE